MDFICSFMRGDDESRRRYIRKNNKKIEASPLRIKGEELLVLVPHCLQWSGCPHKITYLADNCKRCERCAVASILDLRDHYGFSFHVATGGGFAREIIKKTRPRGVVALACERDLFSGIRDMRGIPVYGVLISRENGPCIDTQASMEDIKTALGWMLGAYDTIKKGALKR